MPSLSLAMAASPTVFATEKRNAKLKPTLIMIDNVLGAQDAIITVQDRFTPSVTNGVPVPAVQTPTRLSINVSMNACVSIRDELKDIEILGQMELTIATPDPNCIASVAYHPN